jgi:hypothetical protein
MNLKKSNASSSLLPDQESSIGLYRLLLEWSLSYQTPVPLQRAIQSYLKTLELNSEEISIEVIETLWKEPECWNNALYSLEVAVNNPSLVGILQNSLFSDCFSFLFQAKVSKLLVDETISSLTKDGLVIADILKILLNNYSREQTTIPFQSDFQQFVRLLLACPSMPIDGFNTLGIVYGRLMFCSDPKVLSETAVNTVDTLDAVHDTMSPFARLSMVQGIAATLDLDTLTGSTTASNSCSPLESCWRYSLRVSQVAADPLVRWGALKGLSTLACRWKQQQAINDDISMNHHHDEVIQETLQVVLQAWENPPLRKLGTAIPGLFRTLVQLLNEEQIEVLCQRVLLQPVNRKGRYLALEILLPHMPTSQSIKVESLLEGVGDRGPNTGPIADLWTKLLGHLWTDISKLSDANSSFETWKCHWIPSLSKALVAQSLSRRKQVAAFCLPRIVDLMKGSDSLRGHLSNSFVALIDQVGILRSSKSNMTSLDSSERQNDRALWALLEVSFSAYRGRSREL